MGFKASILQSDVKIVKHDDTKNAYILCSVDCRLRLLSMFCCFWSGLFSEDTSVLD